MLAGRMQQTEPIGKNEIQPFTSVKLKYERRAKTTHSICEN
jgi:hypothetical protein